MDIEKKRAAGKKYYYAHREEMIAASRDYKEAHKEELRQKRKERYQTNREQELQKTNEWKANHPESVRRTARRYHAKHREEANRKRREYGAINQEKLNAKQRAYNAVHREQIKAGYIRRTYGLSLDEWNALYDKQSGCCAICKQSFETIHKLKVDHCHTTGRVRGLLCSNCNTGMGLLKDDINTLKAAIEYLSNNKEP